MNAHGHGNAWCTTTTSKSEAVHRWLSCQTFVLASFRVQCQYVVGKRKFKESLNTIVQSPLLAFALAYLQQFLLSLEDHEKVWNAFDRLVFDQYRNGAGRK